MNVGWQKLENVLNLGLEAAGEHLICLVQYKELQVVCLQEASLHHIVNTPWSAHDYVLALLKDSDVFTHDCATDTSVHLDSKVLANRVHNEGRLHDQLSYWRNDQSLSVIACRVNAL